MSASQNPPLSRREREIMDVLFRLERATAADVLDNLSDAPSYSAVRALLAKLEKKGHITHSEEGRTYVYSPAVRKESARQGALAHLVKTFFDNSTEQAVAALLSMRDKKLTASELDRVAELIERTRKEGR